MTFEDRLSVLLRKHEGVKSFMYRDTAGNVTTGVGHLIVSMHDASQIPWLSCYDGMPADSEESRSEWARVKRGPPSGETEEERISDVAPHVHLTEASIAKLLAADTAIALNQARREISDFDALPDQARVAIVDMIFNLGALEDFPRLKAAIAARDWAMCAAECERRGIGAARNQDTRELFLGCV